MYREWSVIRSSPCLCRRGSRRANQTVDPVLDLFQHIQLALLDLHFRRLRKRPRLKAQRLYAVGKDCGLRSRAETIRIYTFRPLYRRAPILPKLSNLIQPFPHCYFRFCRLRRHTLPLQFILPLCRPCPALVSR